MTVLIPDADLLAKASAPDPERRFGGLRRLHGVSAYETLRAARVAVVGVGGVGSWTAEALARSGVARLVLIDLDNIAESNINRQVHALESTLGQAKVVALKERIAQIHPACVVEAIEEFVDEANVAELLKAQELDGVIDCCDQVRAKAALAAWGVDHGKPVVSVNLPEMEQYADICYLYEGDEEFEKGIETALAEKDQALKEKRIEVARKSSWDQRFLDIHEHLERMERGEGKRRKVL